MNEELCIYTYAFILINYAFILLSMLGQITSGTEEKKSFPAVKGHVQIILMVLTFNPHSILVLFLER